MPVIRTRFRLSLLAVALVASPAFAQTAPVTETTVLRGSTPLGSALGTFAARHGVALSFDPALTQGRLAPLIADGLGVEAGFAALLQGTGLRAERRDDGSYTVHQVAGPRVTAPLRVGTSAPGTYLPQPLPYGQGMTLDADALQAQVKGNGDIATALRSNPAVQFNDTGRSSRNMGEIRPDDFSINGAPYYQNLFLLDGATINNDIDPAVNADSPSNVNNAVDVPSASQGIAVDVDLLESLTVYDANVPASYGGFTGGVVDARSRKARDALHGKVWMRMARSAWDQIIANDAQQDSYEESATFAYQPQYDKYRVGARLEGRTSFGLGIIGTVTRSHSDIPLRAYSGGRDSTGDDVNQKTQTRQNTSASIALDWNNDDGLELAANVSYAPTDDRYYIMNGRDSWFDIRSGGPTASLRANWSHGPWTLRSTLNYSDVESSRRSDLDYMRNWASSDAFNWSPTGISSEGSYGNIDQRDRRIGYRMVVDREIFSIGTTEHRVQLGLGVQRRDGSYERLNDHSVYLSTGVTSSCTLSDGTVDTFSCSLSPLRSGAAGQYFTQQQRYHAGRFEVSGEEYEAWLQDDIRVGNWSLRPGLRLDRNTIWSQTTLSPRLAAAWDVRGDQRTVLNAGINRYYGRSFYSYLLRDGRDRLRETLVRRSARTSWDDATRTWNVATNRLRDIDSPYTDEWTLGIDQRAAGLVFNLKYVNRATRKDILRRKVDDPDRALYNLNTYEFTNGGRSDAEIWTASIASQQPWEVMGTRNSVQLSADRTDVKRNYNSYEDALDMFELVRLDGTLMYRHELPASQFLRPWSARLSTRTEIPALGLSWTNFFRYRAGFEGFTTGPAQTIDGVTAPTLTSRTFSGTWSWDATLEYRLALPQQQEAYARVEVQNVLNRANVGTAATAAAGSIFYEPGRSFWLELGYSF